MDVLLLLGYVLGNMLATLAGLLVLKHYLKTAHYLPSSWNIYNHPTHNYKKFLIAPGLELMLFYSALARAYWSFSPSPVWAHDPLWLRILAAGDCVLSVFLWGGVLMLGRICRRRSSEVGWVLGKVCRRASGCVSV